MDDIDEQSTDERHDKCKVETFQEGKESEDDEFKTLKYSLLGPSLTKAGQEKVDQSKVRTLGPAFKSSTNMSVTGIRNNIQCIERL